MIRVIVGCMAAGIAVAFFVGCDNPERPAAKPCAKGPALPLKATDVIAALRRQGISAVRDPHPLCTAQVVGAVTNTPDPTGSYDELFQREGFVACSIYRSPVPTEGLQRLEDSKKVLFSLANIECAVYFEKDHKAQEIQRLRIAMLDIEATVQQ